MIKNSSVSYSVVPKKGNTKLYSYYHNRQIFEVYNFEHFKIIKFFNEGIHKFGQYETIEKAAEQLIISFKDLKNKEFDKKLCGLGAKVERLPDSEMPSSIIADD